MILLEPITAKRLSTAISKDRGSVRMQEIPNYGPPEVIHDDNVKALALKMVGFSGDVDMGKVTMNLFKGSKKGNPVYLLSWESLNQTTTTI